MLTAPATYGVTQAGVSSAAAIAGRAGAAATGAGSRSARAARLVCANAAAYRMTREK